MNLGKAVKLARTGYFTQKEVAEMTGVTNVYISLIESNKRECSLKWLKKFSLVVGLSIPVIFYMSMDDEDATVGMEDEFEVMKPLIDTYFSQAFGIKSGKNDYPE